MTSIPPHQYSVRSNEPPAPPLSAPPPPPPPEPAWPQVIGIIAIVFGGFGVLGGCWGIVSPFFMAQMGQFMPAQPGPDPFAMIEQWKAWIIAASVATLLIAAWLLIGGIGLVKRASWAVKTLVGWAVVKMLFVLVNSVIGYFMQTQQFEAMAQSDPNLSQMQTFLVAMGVVGVVFGIAWGWAFPVFVLVWFSRRKVKGDISGWGQSSSDRSIAGPRSPS